MKDSKSYFQFKYKVLENGLGQNVKVSLYRSITPIKIQENHFNCEKKSEKIENSNDTKYFETCEEKELGNLIQETTLNGGSEDLVIGKDLITILEDNADVTRYYYVVVEFLNKEESQNEDMNLSLVGRVTVELTTPFESDFANKIETLAVSMNESWARVETFSIHVTSEKYDLISMSEDLENWEELESIGKDITIEKTVTLNGAYSYYFQDEAGNIKEVTMVATKVDNKKPTANISLTSSDNIITIDASDSKDNESNIVKYYYSLDGENFEESNENTYSITDPGVTYGIATEAIKSISTIEAYVKVEDEAGNISDVKKATKSRIGGNVSSIAYDETADNNLRYIGANPNNYVWFNNELWRIIGVMNNINDGTGKKETRVKIIRNESIGEYSWDTSASNVNDGEGVNEWSQSKVMQLLNPGFETKEVGGSLYWNRTKGKCYNGKYNASTNCDFTNVGLSDKAWKMVDKVLWNTGSNGSIISNDNINASKFYELERSESTGHICANEVHCDKTERLTSWFGKIGLMYPSDYGYATSGGNSKNRTSCLNTTLYNWYASNASDCRNNNWLYKTYNQWTMTPRAYSTGSNTVFSVFNVRAERYYRASSSYAILPTLYLKSNVKITSGKGTTIEPFHLELEED